MASSRKNPGLSPEAIVKKYKRGRQDTGSTGVQVALISERIQELVGHLKAHPKDTDSRRGLLQMVGRRRRLLNYLKRDELKTYEKLIADLGLRK